MRTAGAALNIVLRVSIGYFLAEVMLNPDDPRFAGKAIPIRNLIIVGGLSLLFPALHVVRRRWRRYPVWTDNVWLSLFWLDMAGNSFDLYDRYLHFDLIPHFHGTGASAVALQRGFDLTPRRAFVIATVLHSALEAQEYATDVFFGTHNVRGWWDSAGDIAVGLLGAVAYLWGPRPIRGLYPWGPTLWRPRARPARRTGAGPEFVLFHTVADPASARIRREIIARGLKPRIDFQNVGTKEGAELFAVRQGTVLPAIWDGERLLTGADMIDRWLSELTGRAKST
jgi:hypothetical protein